MRLAYLRGSKEASAAGTEWIEGGVETSHQPSPKSLPLTLIIVLQHLQQVSRVGRWDAKRRAASFIRSSNKYFLSTYSVEGTVLASGYTKWT